jgi:hypothetical protein
VQASQAILQGLNFDFVGLLFFIGRKGSDGRRDLGLGSGSRLRYTLCWEAALGEVQHNARHGYEQHKQGRYCRPDPVSFLRPWQ